MKIKILSAFLTALCLLPSMAFAEENKDEPAENIHTLTFRDFDGNVMQEIKVSPDEKIDYSLVDTSPLHTHLDIYTERDFYMWSVTPETIDTDTEVQALYKKATLAVESLPTKTEYYSSDGSVNLDGLSVTITLETQTPITDENGDFYIDIQTEDIAENCYAEIPELEKLFADGKTATVNIIPTGDTKTLATYSISLFENLGDVNGDGHIDSVDASVVLQMYAELSTDRNDSVNDETKKIIDVNRDGFVDSVDSSLILNYYSLASRGNTTSWEDLIPSLR
ncbi:MAG: hypothetical protein K2J08_09805 [Ruminococcus sp.]|nr:hypothetical protein [Ruminococcus sp.]